MGGRIGPRIFNRKGEIRVFSVPSRQKALGFIKDGGGKRLAFWAGLARQPECTILVCHRRGEVWPRRRAGGPQIRQQGLQLGDRVLRRSGRL
jgi:hypothetical protein